MRLRALRALVDERHRPALAANLILAGATAVAACLAYQQPAAHASAPLAAPAAPGGIALIPALNLDAAVSAPDPGAAASVPPGGGHPLLDALVERDAAAARSLGGGVSAASITPAELLALRRAGARCPDAIYQLAWPVAGVFGIDQALLLAMVDRESGCNARAHSSAGARGLLQLMPRGGAQAAYRLLYGKDGVPTAASLEDPNTSLWLGAAYLRFLIDHYAYVRAGQARLRLAVAGYNWDYARVDRTLPPGAGDLDAGAVDRWIALRTPLETRGYVPAVMARAARYAAALAPLRGQVASADAAPATVARD